MAQKKTSLRSNGLGQHQQEMRAAMCARIDEAIAHMREEKATITKKALAEELGVQEKTMYSAYVKQHLLTIKEFNPALQEAFDNVPDVEEIEAERNALKLRNRELTARVKELTQVLKEANENRKILEQRYERVFGLYQEAVGSKIVPF